MEGSIFSKDVQTERGNDTLIDERIIETKVGRS